MHDRLEPPIGSGRRGERQMGIRPSANSEPSVSAALWATSDTTAVTGRLGTGGFGSSWTYAVVPQMECTCCRLHTEEKVSKARGNVGLSIAC